MDEVIDTNPSPETTSAGGLAPEDRACQYTKSDGHRCRNWALHGHQHCFRHQRYVTARPERPIDVPLLEDQDSLTYVLSQTIQALAWGTLPTANGHAILAACRLVQNGLNSRIETAKLRVKVRRLGIPEQEIFDAPGAASEASCTEHQQQQEKPGQDPTGQDPIPNPIKIRPRHIRFPDLKKDWDKGLLRTENAAGDMYARRYGQTQEDFLASHATPFDHLAEVDREVERAHALAKAHQQDLAGSPVQTQH